MGITNQRVAKHARSIAARGRSGLKKRELRLEVLERRYSMDASFGESIVPIDLSFDASLVGPIIPSAIVVSLDDPIPGIAQEIGVVDQANLVAIDLPTTAHHENCVSGSQLSDNDLNDSSSDSKSDEVVIDNRFDQLDPVDNELSGCIGLVDSNLTGAKDGDDKLGQLANASEHIRFIPFEGPLGTLSLNHSGGHDRPELTPETIVERSHRAMINTNLANAVSHELASTERSKLSLTKTRYFEKESINDGVETSLAGFRNLRTSLRAFASRDISEDSGISIGPHFGESRRREVVARRQHKTTESPLVSAEGTKVDAFSVTSHAAKTDLAIMELVEGVAVDQRQSTSLESHSKKVKAIGYRNNSLVLSNRDERDRSAEQSENADENGLVANVGRFAFLGMLVSHGFLSRSCRDASKGLDRLSHGAKNLSENR